MDPPECPVCLQPYEFAGGAAPRVLLCGHSACESCLCALPRRPAAPSTLRCPACNILVRIPDLGPSALPKNIDLLRFCSPASQAPLDRDTPVSDSIFFLTLTWSEGLHSKWRDLVLPPDSISAVTFGGGSGTATASLSDSSSFSIRNYKVNLFPLGVSSFFSAQRDRLRLSYMARVMISLQKLEETRLEHLRLLASASSSCRPGRISRVFGLWTDPGDELSDLFVVFERFDKGVLGFSDTEARKIAIFPFAMMVLEMCEAVMRLHSECIVCGCLSPSCFAFDDYGHCILDLSSVLICGKEIHGESSDPSNSDSAVFASPEIFVSLHASVGATDCGFDDFVGYESDVWSLACVIAMILFGDTILVKELFQGFHSLFHGSVTGSIVEPLLDHYEAWKKKVVSKLEALLLETELESFLLILKSSLSYHRQERPQVKELWSSIRSLLTKNHVSSLAAMDVSEVKESTLKCLIIKDMYSMKPVCNSLSKKIGIDDALVDSFRANEDCSNRSECMNQDIDFCEGLNDDSFKSITIEAHHDFITALAVGGGYLYSASLDKTIKMWFLQDFSLAQTLKGHEHKIMTMVVIDGIQPLCISGDNASGIFVWQIGTSANQKLLKNWYEHNDWRYSGIHALAVSGTTHLYSGGGDKSIKAWSLQDYSLSCVMTGHKSTVSSLVVCDGVLYSGSWDGSIRLWSLFDHSLLSELGDSTLSSHSVLSLSVNHHLVLSSHETGCVKIWRNDMFVKLIDIQKGAIFALHVDSKWMCTGGSDMIVNIQELFVDEFQVDVRPVASLMFDSVITSLLLWRGKLFVGFSNKIKVFHATKQNPIDGCANALNGE